jgi:hypothetical protein
MPAVPLRYGSWGVCFTYAAWFGVSGLVARGYQYDTDKVRQGCNPLPGVCALVISLLHMPATNNQANGGDESVPMQCQSPVCQGQSRMPATNHIIT